MQLQAKPWFESEVPHKVEKGSQAVQIVLKRGITVSMTFEGGWAFRGQRAILAPDCIPIKRRYPAHAHDSCFPVKMVLADGKVSFSWVWIESLPFQQNGVIQAAKDSFTLKRPNLLKNCKSAWSLTQVKSSVGLTFKISTSRWGMIKSTMFDLIVIIRVY